MPQLTTALSASARAEALRREQKARQEALIQAQEEVSRVYTL